MSYAIIRNEKLTRAKSYGAYVHNDRKAKNHSNKDIDPNDFHKYVTSKGFDLGRGLPVEETGAKNLKIEELKKITNFANTKKLLNNIKLELPKVPDINDIKLIQLNKAKVEKDIIKPQNDMIKELHEDNLALHKELPKQSKLINEAEKICVIVLLYLKSVGRFFTKERRFILWQKQKRLFHVFMIYTKNLALLQKN